MHNQNSLHEFHFDVLKEVGNIGAANSATALSHLLHRRIEMEVPRVNVVEINQAIDEIGGPERLVVQIFLRVDGEVPGSVFFILSLQEAYIFLEELLGERVMNLDRMLESDIALSALKEVGNILCGSYVTALSNFTRLNMYPSVPNVCIDMLGATMTSGLIEASVENEHVLMIDTVLAEKQQCSLVKGNFLLVPDNGALDAIFKALGVQIDE
ncbi:chemotaxis protein CheC [Priestia megaterium]|nr:chemotaxis protein CheC [Priestia megaterium]